MAVLNPTAVPGQKAEAGCKERWEQTQDEYDTWVNGLIEDACKRGGDFDTLVESAGCYRRGTVKEIVNTVRKTDSFP